jgi:hypothetical protein
MDNISTEKTLYIFTECLDIDAIINSTVAGMSNSKQGRIHPLLLQTLKQDNIDNYFLN